MNEVIIVLRIYIKVVVNTKIPRSESLGFCVNKTHERLLIYFSYHVGLGNSLIKREMDLQGQIRDIKMEKSRYSEKIYDLQDNIRVKYPTQI